MRSILLRTDVQDEAVPERLEQTSQVEGKAAVLSGELDDGLVRDELPHHRVDKGCTRRARTS